VNGISKNINDLVKVLLPFGASTINTGQVCNCIKPVYVQEDVADEFIEKITKAMSEVSYGDPSISRQKY